MSWMGAKDRKKIILERKPKEVSVLKVLRDNKDKRGTPKQLDIKDLCERTGITDLKDIQRYLFILEGQRLVSPNPPKNLTSSKWIITEDGINTVDYLFSE